VRLRSLKEVERLLVMVRTVLLVEEFEAPRRRPMGHGGGQRKKAPGIVDRARRFVAECGFAAPARLATGACRWAA
jgi:hypothetical protein